jgi:RNA polymerase sigma factor (sigma-70 family)
MRDGDGQEAAGQLRTAAEGDALVVAVLRRHGDVVLRIARRHSLCDEDAADASQRAMEIFLRHVRRLEEETAHRWLFRVVRNEALSVRDQRQRILGPAGLDADELEARHVESPEDRVIALEATAQAAEALLALKQCELQALVMQASGDSYARIAQRSGWSATKVNRAVYEGRKRLRDQRDAIVDGRECERWRPALAALVEGRASAKQVTAVRPHLRNCGACRAHVRALHRAGAPGGPAGAKVAAVAPVGLAGLPWGGGRLGGWLVRLHDAVGVGVQERLALRALKLQMAAEALSAGKVAAVAASAAAIASGGVAVVDAGSGAGAERAGDRSAAATASAPGGGARVRASLLTATPRAGQGGTGRPTQVRVGPLRGTGGAVRVGGGSPLGPAPAMGQQHRPTEFRVRSGARVPAEVRSARRAARPAPVAPFERPAAAAASAGEFAAARPAGSATSPAPAATTWPATAASTGAGPEQPAPPPDDAEFRP